MQTGPDIAAVAALIGEPGRARMLTALLPGEALTAGELAREAGVTAQTASSHLAKLQTGGLLAVRRQGRHTYFTLAGPDVAAAIAGLSALAERAGHSAPQPGPRDPALRRARVCYDHMAGDAGVRMLDSLVARGLVDRREEALELSVKGDAFMQALGLDVPRLRRGRRALCKGCLDWSVRRSHLAGSLGAALLERFYALGWASREAASREVTFTAKGLHALDEIFGVRLPD